MRPICSLRGEGEKEEGDPGPLISTLIAGAVAGFFNTSIVYPLDTIKTRLQSSQGFRAAGGFRGLYKGFWIQALGSMPINSIFFGSYETIKHLLEPRVPPSHAAAVHMCTASFARVLSLSVRVPVEIVKQRQQVTKGKEKVRAVSILFNAYRKEGIRHGLYRGFASTLIRDMPFSFIEMPIWEVLKATLRKYTNKTKLNSIQSAGCGVIAGGIAGAITTPVDLIKTRIILANTHGKASYESLRVRVVLSQIYSEAGLRGLFAGIMPRVTMIMFGGFIFYTIYEEAKDWLDDWFESECVR